MPHFSRAQVRDLFHQPASSTPRTPSVTNLKSSRVLRALATIRFGLAWKVLFSIRAFRILAQLGMNTHPCLDRTWYVWHKHTLRHTHTHSPQSLEEEVPQYQYRVTPLASCRDQRARRDGIMGRMSAPILYLLCAARSSPSEAPRKG